MGTEKKFRNVFVTGDLEVKGNTTLEGITITSSSADLSVETLTASSGISANNTITGSSDLNITQNILSSGTITAVTGLASSSGTLDVDTSTFRGLITASSALNVNNAITGTSDISAGATLTASSDLDVNNTLTMSSGMAVPVEEGTTTVAASSGYFVMQPYGHAHITVDSTNEHVWVLPAPVAGARKTIAQATVISTSNPNSVVLVSGVTMVTTGAINLTKWNAYAVGATLDLAANTATEWSVVSHKAAGITVSPFAATTST